MLPGGDAAVKKLLVANLAREAQARAEAARRGGLDLFPCRTQVGVGGCVERVCVCALLAPTPYPLTPFVRWQAPCGMYQR